MAILYKATIAILFTLPLYTVQSIADPGSPEGHWVTVDDETGEDKSIVQLWIEGGALHGRIVELINAKENNPVCTLCQGDLKDQPVTGLKILGDATLKGKKWAGGYIVDPNTGKRYKVVLKLIERGSKLKVRGFVGVSAFGRTQIWRRK